MTSWTSIALSSIPTPIKGFDFSLNGISDPDGIAIKL